MANAELAFNEQDNILYYGWGTGGAGGTATQALAIGGPGAFQAIDADLTAIAALSTTGLAVRTAANTWALRSITAPAAGITITNGDGVSGNPTLALANDLAALEGLSTTGLIARTADGAATTRSVAGTAGNITVSNGSGVAGNPTIDLATVSVNAVGTLSTTYVLTDVTVDTYGRVNAYTNINLVDISLDQFNVPQANLSINSKRLTNLADPVNAQDAATKVYVDAARSGLDVKQSCRAASTANINFGVGNEFNIGGAPLVVDGVTLVAGDRVLVKDQSSATYNGIWVVITPGTGSDGSWTRPSDFNGSATVTAGAFTFVAEGTVNADSGWVLTTNDTITWGTTGLTFAQFSGAGQITAGVGLIKSGNTLDINVGSGANSAGLEIASDQLKVKLGAHLAFNGTTGAVDVQTGTSGATIPLLNGANFWSGINVFLSPVDEIATSQQTMTQYPSLEVRQNDPTKDAYMMFHVEGNYAVFFGLDSPSNRLCTAGFSLGTTKKFILNDQDEIDGGTF